MTRLRRVSYDPPPSDGWCLPNEAKNITDLRVDFSHVTTHYEDRGYNWLKKGVPMEVIARELEHPSLRRLQAEHVFFTIFPSGKWLGEHRSSVEDLRFLDCSPKMDVDVLAAFIDSSKGLKCFILEIRSPWEGPGPESLIDFRPVLKPYHETIEELAISTTTDVLTYYDIGSQGDTFHDWTALKRLAIPIIMLSGEFDDDVVLHDVLPPQMEELQLEENLWISNGKGPIDEDKNLNLFKDLANHKVAHVPGLKHLIWWIQYDTTRNSTENWPSVPEGIVEKLAPSTFLDVGVEFECVFTLFFKETPFGKRLYEWN